MATTKSTGAATPTPTPMPAPTAAPDPIMTFDQLQAQMTSITALGAAGKEYVKNLTKTIEDKAGASIVVEQIPYKTESVACIHNAAKQAVILVFAESYVGTNKLPPTECMPDVIAAFKAKHPDIAMVQYIIVAECDYSRYENMAIHVINTFKALAPNVKLTAAIFHEMRLTPSTDINQVRKFIEQRSPHEVQDRADWGVLINRVSNATRATMYNTSKEPEMDPIFAVAGYTKFIKTIIQGVVKYVPICVITNVTSVIPSTDILNLALPIAAGCIIAQRVWERPYTSFAKDKPNLGRLRFTADNKTLDWFTSIDQMHAELPKILTDVPYLAIDCAEGRARIPGLEKYAISGPEAVMQQLEGFFGPTATAAFNQFQQSPIITTFFNYEGSYKTNGQTVDTRNGDYINMVTDTKDYQRCQYANQQFMTPGEHLSTIANIYGEDVVTPLYRVHTIIFNSNLINVLATMVSNVVRYTGEACINQTIDMGVFLAQFNAQIGGSNAIYGGVNYSSAPGNLYY